MHTFKSRSFSRTKELSQIDVINQIDAFISYRCIFVSMRYQIDGNKLIKIELISKCSLVCQ